MQLEVLPGKFCVLKLKCLSLPQTGPYFLGLTEEEISLVCLETEIPLTPILAEEHGWRALRVVGTLDFALTGILAKLASALAEEGIPIFAQSTFDTDYLLLKEPLLPRALRRLGQEGYEVLEG